ncbi:unannotated protein [freshwater metagenome]|uniref:Unannotated protein n=1 Tax=freshwater metagenome TaxID=449393 RepID=A0A6J7EIS2_9ZZZZ|nr:dehydratase [Actinomycetota bacterium]
MAATVLHGEDGLRSAVDAHLGYSDWLEVDAARIALFAQATGDIDATYLSISLSNMFLPQIVEVRGFSMGINYGTETVRFPTPLVAGTALRGGASLEELTEVRGGVQTRMLITIESRDAEGLAGKPVCIIESISRWLH